MVTRTFTKQKTTKSWEAESFFQSSEIDGSVAQIDPVKFLEICVGEELEEVVFVRFKSAFHRRKMPSSLVIQEAQRMSAKHSSMRADFYVLSSRRYIAHEEKQGFAIKENIKVKTNVCNEVEDALFQKSIRAGGFHPRIFVDRK